MQVHTKNEIHKDTFCTKAGVLPHKKRALLGYG